MTTAGAQTITSTVAITITGNSFTAVGGSSSDNVQASVTDANLLTNAGGYYGNSSSMANVPFKGAFTMQVTGSSTNLSQIMVDVPNNEQWRRTLNGTAWSIWTKNTDFN